MHVALNRAVALLLLVALAPVLLLLALAIRLDSPGPAFFSCERVGLHGRMFRILKFRKMWRDATGPALTAAKDDRLTRLGSFLVASKLDELPQLWNVLRGEMNLVGPRPEAPEFVAAGREAYDGVLTVRPGITGFSQLAFRRESEILDPSDRTGDYVNRVLPQKLNLDRLYARRRSLLLDLQILYWTFVSVIFRHEVAVDRTSGRMRRRERPRARVDETTVLGRPQTPPVAIEFLPREGSFDIPDLVRALLAAKLQVGAYKYEGSWFDIGRKEDYEEAVAAWGTRNLDLVSVLQETLSRTDVEEAPVTPLRSVAVDSG